MSISILYKFVSIGVHASPPPHSNQWCPEWEACQRRYRGRGMLDTARRGCWGPSWLYSLTYPPMPDPLPSCGILLQHVLHCVFVALIYQLLTQNQSCTPLLTTWKSPSFFRYLHQEAYCCLSISVLTATFPLQVTDLIMDFSQLWPVRNEEKSVGCPLE